MKRFTQTLTALAFFAMACVGNTADGALLVYEGFNYESSGTNDTNSDDLAGQPGGSGPDVDATGLSGSWVEEGQDEFNNIYVVTGSIEFAGVVTTGNSVRATNNSNYDRTTRGVSADLDSGSELWFSFLANKLANNFSAAEGGIVIGSGNLPTAQGRVLDTNPAGYHGFAIAPTTNGNDWTGYAWDGTTQTAGAAHLDVATNGTEINLLVGRVEFDIAGETDRLTVSYYDAVLESLVTITTLTADVDETLLDTLIIARQVNTAYDEIRIGMSQDDVLVFVPTPAALPAGLALLGLIATRRRRMK